MIGGAFLWAFDLLELGGVDLRPLALGERRNRLRQLLAVAPTPAENAGLVSMLWLAAYGAPWICGRCGANSTFSRMAASELGRACCPRVLAGDRTAPNKANASMTVEAFLNGVALTFGGADKLRLMQPNQTWNWQVRHT